MSQYTDRACLTNMLCGWQKSLKSTVHMLGGRAAFQKNVDGLKELDSTQQGQM